MAKNMLVTAKILKVNTLFHAGIDVQPVTPLEWAFPSVQLTSLHYFLWCPVINRETKFAFAIKDLVILLVLHWQTKVK